MQDLLRIIHVNLTPERAADLFVFGIVFLVRELAGIPDVLFKRNTTNAFTQVAQILKNQDKVLKAAEKIEKQADDVKALHAEMKDLRDETLHFRDQAHKYLPEFRREKGTNEL